MIRGKKNFLPSCQLQLGFGLLFRLDDESMEKHKLTAKQSGLVLNDLQVEEEIIPKKETNISELEDEENRTNDDVNEELSLHSESNDEDSSSAKEFPDVQVNF